MTNFKHVKPKEPLKYCDTLWKLLPEIKKNIEESPTKIISISIDDFKKKLGTKFQVHSNSTVYYMTKYGLIEEGINVQRTKDDNLRMRYRTKENDVPKGLDYAKRHGHMCKSGKQIR